MAHPGGAKATKAITSIPGGPRVLILTTYDTEADILAAVEAGASGYLLKDAPPDELTAAVRAAAAGQSALAPAIAQRLMQRIQQPSRSLSSREAEVLTLVAEGLSNQQISQQLFLSQATIKSHLVHIFTKLGVDSRTAAVAAAEARGLIRRTDRYKGPRGDAFPTDDRAADTATPEGLNPPGEGIHRAQAIQPVVCA